MQYQHNPTVKKRSPWAILGRVVNAIILLLIGGIFGAWLAFAIINNYIDIDLKADVQKSVLTQP